MEWKIKIDSVDQPLARILIDRDFKAEIHNPLTAYVEFYVRDENGNKKIVDAKPLIKSGTFEVGCIYQDDGVCHINLITILGIQIKDLASSRFGNAVILDPEKSCLILNATAADLRLIADAMDRIAVLSEGD